MDINITEFSKGGKEIFPKGQPLLQLATGYGFTEGPVWDETVKQLYFTDFTQELILIWSKSKGDYVYRRDSGRAIGLYLDGDGKLISAESKSRAITIVDNDKSVAVADNYKGRRLNSPNDVIVSKSGRIYFSDPYSVPLGMPREIEFNGMFSILPGGEATVICDNLKRPNGLALSPDESILYLNDSERQLILSCHVGSDGNVSDIKELATLDTSFGDGVVDGMKTDIEGNIYVTGPGGIWVISSSGEPVSLLHIPEVAGNLCFGDDDGQTLFITASKSLYSVRTTIPGVLPHRKKV